MRMIIRTHLLFLALAVFIGNAVFASNSSENNQRIISKANNTSDSLFLKILGDIYSSFTGYNSKMISYPNQIHSLFNWLLDDEKVFVYKLNGFDSIDIEAQLNKNEIIILNSNNQEDLIQQKRKEFFRIDYIIFSKDRQQLIIKDMFYCGEDCGKGRIALYKLKKGKWVFKKTIFGWVS